MRVSPPKVFPVATGAAKPPADAAGSVDAFRQTGFVLGEEVELVLAGLNLEGAAAQQAAVPARRTQKMVSALGLWSRSWLARLEALHALQWGNYSAATALVRSAADYQASMLYLLQTGSAEWEEWLSDGGVAIAAAEHATEFRLHAFRAGEVLAAHETLGRIYRISTDLSLSHFGSTLMFAGAGSAPDHIEMTFGDRDFHVGLAELVAGWLLDLGAALGESLTTFEGVFGPDVEGARAKWTERATKTSAGSSRCRVETLDTDAGRRYLVVNWRREPRSAAKRLLL
ncbi:MAG TPA: hypothetical protein PKK39_02625 [Tepidiformaceae bacterium]|nr:hypothetical protein [Tepidiformaceae bacterium]